MRAEDELRRIIKDKINYRVDTTDERGCKYDGFDMSGYGDGHFKNLELISRFSNYMNFQNEKVVSRSHDFAIPIFWKGVCDIRRINVVRSELEFSDFEELGGETSEDIIFKTILSNNPNIMKQLGDDEDAQYLEDLIIESGNDGTDGFKEEVSFKSGKYIPGYIRNISLVKELKQKYSKCQICNFTFKKKDGENYNEVHHIIPLSMNGKDAKINTLVVCANCHRQLHYADVNISNILKGEIKINGEIKKINNG